LENFNIIENVIRSKDNKMGKQKKTNGKHHYTVYKKSCITSTSSNSSQEQQIQVCFS